MFHYKNLNNKKIVNYLNKFLYKILPNLVNVDISEEDAIKFMIKWKILFENQSYNIKRRLSKLYIHFD